MGGCCVSSAADVPLTTDNICKELAGVNCMKRLGLGVWLRVPDHQPDEIELQHSTQANQTRAIIDLWLSVDLISVPLQPIQEGYVYGDFSPTN